MKKSFKTSPDDNGKRIDSVISAKFAECSRAKVKRLIETGAVSANGEKINEAKKKIKDITNIEISFPEKNNEKNITGEKIPLEIIYEDDSILVINKPPGIIVHPGAGNQKGSIVNALVGRNENFANNFEDQTRPGIVHRLDKDTSGCLVTAKTQEIQNILIKLFSSRQVEKKYLALTYRVPPHKEGVIDTFFGRHPVSRKKMSVLDFSPKRAISEYKILKEIQIEGLPCAVVEINLKTGRTHQIRVHLAHIKSPVLGDKLYGGKQKISVPRQVLHAWKIPFPHPKHGKPMHFESPIPQDFSSYAGRI